MKLRSLKFKSVKSTNDIAHMLIKKKKIKKKKIRDFFSENLIFSSFVLHIERSILTCYQVIY